MLHSVLTSVLVAFAIVVGNDGLRWALVEEPAPRPTRAKPIKQGAWYVDLVAGLHAQRQLKKPALIYFSGKHCGPCRRMDAFFRTRASIQVARQYVLIHFFIEDRPKIARRYGISAMPTFVVLDRQGKQRARLVGAVSNAQFLAWVLGWLEPERLPVGSPVFLPRRRCIGGVCR